MRMMGQRLEIGHEPLQGPYFLVIQGHLPISFDVI